MSKGLVMVRVAVFASFFVILINNTQGKECGSANISRSGSREKDPTHWSTLWCPRQMDPPGFTECCFFNTSTPCCKPTEKAFFHISDTMAMVIAISVTSVCTAVTVAVIVCCFSSRCPLYTVCRVRYTRSEIASFTKSTDSTSMNNMPSEATEKTKLSFSPHIKNKNIGSAV